jgi:hypothetical protein
VILSDVIAQSRHSQGIKCQLPIRHQPRGRPTQLLSGHIRLRGIRGLNQQTEAVPERGSQQERKLDPGVSYPQGAQEDDENHVCVCVCG